MEILDFSKTRKAIVKFCYGFFLILFLVWLYQAVNNYQSWATSSKVSYKYGDEGDKLVRFPSVSICQMGDFGAEDKSGIIYENNVGSVWKNVNMCQKLKLRSSAKKDLCF